MRPDIAFVGTGNVAFRFSLALQEKGYAITQIYGRTARNRDRLVKALHINGSAAEPAKGYRDLCRASLVFITVADDAIGSVVREMASEMAGADRLPAVVHTSGATDMDVLQPLADIGCKCGVVYPLMTLSRNKNIDFTDVPLLLETDDTLLRDMLDGIASDLGGEYYFYNSEQRLRMHLAAVFTTNFVNYILGLAFPILDHDYPLLLPSTIEAVRNAFLHTPESTLTGPARRGDMNTVRKHLDLLKRLGLEEQEEFYRSFTEKILEKYHHK